MEYLVLGACGEIASAASHAEGREVESCRDAAGIAPCSEGSNPRSFQARRQRWLLPTLAAC